MTAITTSSSMIVKPERTAAGRARSTLRPFGQFDRFVPQCDRSAARLMTRLAPAGPLTGRTGARHVRSECAPVHSGFSIWTSQNPPPYYRRQPACQVQSNSPQKQFQDNPAPAARRSSFPNHLDQDPLGPVAIELTVEDLFPRPEDRSASPGTDQQVAAVTFEFAFLKTLSH